MAIRGDDELRYVPLTSGVPLSESIARDVVSDVASDEMVPALEFDEVPHTARLEPCALCGSATSPPEAACRGCGAVLTWPVYRASDVVAAEEPAEPVQAWPPGAVALDVDVAAEPRVEVQTASSIAAESAPVVTHSSGLGGYTWLDAVAVIGAVMIIAGSTMVWARAGFINVPGTDGDGAITLVGGIIIAVLVLLRAQVGRFIGLVLAFLVLADVIYVGVNLSRVTGGGIFGLRVGEGIYVTGAGAALAAIALIIRMSTHRSW